MVIQAWDFRPGSNFVSQMNDAAKQAERTLAVLSSAYMASEFAEVEWAAAFADDPTGKAGKLVPVRIEQLRPVGVVEAAGVCGLGRVGGGPSQGGIVGWDGAASGEAAVPAGVSPFGPHCCKGGGGGSAVPRD